MLRSFFIYLSKATWARKIVTGWSVAWKMASRFVAGEKLEDAIRVIQALNSKGINATLDHLGEHTTTAEEARRATKDICDALEAIQSSGVKANVSIKLTQIGLGLGPEICKENLFTIFLIINLVSDVLDGFIARTFHMESELGAKLDAFADNFNFLLAYTGMFIFKMDDLRPHLVPFIIYIGFMVSLVVVALIKFGKFPSFHLMSTRIGGYIQGAFVICLFTIGFFKIFFYFTIIWGMLSAVEHIAIQMLLPELRVNVKGLYWVLKERRKMTNDRRPMTVNCSGRPMRRPVCSGRPTRRPVLK